MAFLAQAPALPLDEAGKYVAGAYLVFFALVLIYVAIMASRLSRLERDLAELVAMGVAEGDGDRAAPAVERPHEAPPGSVADAGAEPAPARVPGAGAEAAPR